MAELLPVHALVNGGVILHYFRTSDVYGSATTDLGAFVGITKVADADLTGGEPIVPVKELIRAGDMSRIAIRYKTTDGKRKSAKILVNRLKFGDVFGDVVGKKLEASDVDYKVGTTTKGKIKNVGQIRRATTY